MNANLSVEDRKVLLRSTEAKPHTANGVDQRVSLPGVGFAADPADIDVDDIGCRIKVQIPHMLKQHRSRDNLPRIARKICQQLEFSREQVDLPTLTAGDAV